MTLKNILVNNNKSRRIFGKKEIEIILNQLEGLPLKQSERNRLSRDIKPKLDFIREIIEFKDEFPLKKNQDNNKLIEKAVNVILKDISKDNINAILLFGSFADNTFTKRSDIDIAVIFKKEISLKEATLFRQRISGELPEKIDVQVFNILPLRIKRSVARNHKVLFKAKEYDNFSFSIKYLKDDDYFIRLNQVFGVKA